MINNMSEKKSVAIWNFNCQLLLTCAVHILFSLSKICILPFFWPFSGIFWGRFLYLKSRFITYAVSFCIKVKICILQGSNTLADNSTQ